MSRIFRFLIVATLAAVLIVPATFAQDKGIGERATYGTNYATVDPGLQKPNYDGTPVGNWQNTYPLVIGPGEEVWFGTWNSYVDTTYKNYWLKLEGDNLFALEVVQTWAYTDAPPAEVPHKTITTKTPGPGKLTFHASFEPQPEWEVIKVQNSSSQNVTVTGASGESQCWRIEDPRTLPSLTTYGIIVLVLLLIASTVWVIRRKRAGVPA